MTAATAGPSGPQLFSMFSGERKSLYGANRETFALSLLGHAAILALLIYLTSCIIQSRPEVIKQALTSEPLEMIFFGHGGGGGGGLEKMPASHGDLPKASLENQFTPPTVHVPREMPRLPMPQTVAIAPDVRLVDGDQVGDPLSKYRILSNGPGGPTGVGDGCCSGVGPSKGPGFGPGPEGIYPAGRFGATVPELIDHPEPSFSDEARKTKTQGAVVLLLVVGKDGRPYNISVRQSLGMGLDEKAIAAVNHWRFRPATMNGQPVATRVEIEVDFRLY